MCAATVIDPGFRRMGRWGARPTRAEKDAAMSQNADAFDHWIRGSFVEMNTALEELYFAQEPRDAVEGVGDDIKQAIEA